MRNLQRFGAVVLVAAVVALPIGAQAGKKKDAPLPSDKPDGSKLPSNKYVGVLKSTPNSDRMFDVEMPYGGKKVVVEFQMAEKAKVRTMLLPELFDSKGNPKKYTKKEIDELKGKDRTLPGYESSVEGLAAGQTVQFTLAAASKTPAPAGKKKDDDAEKASVEKSRQVRLVVITSAPEGSEGGGPRKKK